VALAFAGAGAGLHQTETPKQAESLPAGQADAVSRPRIDRYGDPLPPGAIARLGTLRFRDVRGCLAFSPDGKLLATATGDESKCVTFWEVTTGRAIRRIEVSSTLSRLAFSPDGQRLACSTNRCQVLEVASGKELFAVKGVCGGFSADGKMLVTDDIYTTDRRGYVWDAATGRQLRRWPDAKENHGFLEAVGGQTLAIRHGTVPAIVEIRDIATGRKIRSFRRGKTFVDSDGWRYLTLSRDDKVLAGTTIDAIELLDIEKREIVASWRGQLLDRCVFSPDGKRLAWTGVGEQEGGGLRLWIGERTGDGGMRVVSAPCYTHQSPCFSPDGKLVAAVTRASTVSLHEAATGKKVYALDAHDGPVIFMAFTPDCRHVISRAHPDIFAWEARSCRLLRRDPGPLARREFIEHVLPDGRLLTNDPDQNLVRLRDMLTGRVDQRMPAIRPAFDSPVSVPAPAGRYVAIHRGDSEVSVFDLRMGKCKYRLDSTEARRGMKLSDDGDVLVWYNGADGQVNVHVRRQTSGKTHVLHIPADTVDWVHSFEYNPCLSPDGRWLVLPTREGSLRRWDLTNGEEARPLAEPLENIEDFRWSPDGRFLALCGEVSQPDVRGRRGPREMRVWDVAVGVRLTHLTLPGPPTLVRFAPDGWTMLTTAEGVIHLWETATGKERARLKGHQSYEIGSLALSADGRMLVSGGHDSQVLVWDLTRCMPDGQWHPARLSPDKLRAAWETLAGADAASAYAAMWQLVADPEGSTTLLRSRLRPVAHAEDDQVAQLIAALDSEKFAERERATRELETLEDAAAAELRQTLTRKPSLEVRRRVEALLERLNKPLTGERLQSMLERLNKPLTGEQLQSLRAIEVLEHIGTPQAREVLKTLSEGAPEARTTEEARRTLRRLDQEAAGP
jgi:WD40 repeat protein